MNKTDLLWGQIFEEEPINAASLQSLKNGVMAQIFAHPTDFQTKLLIAQRRKWGAILLAVLMIVGLGVFSLIWFKGEWLLSLVIYAPGRLFEQGKRLSQLMIGIEFLWQIYVWPFLGIAISWVLFDGIRHKMAIKE